MERWKYNGSLGSVGGRDADVRTSRSSQVCRFCFGETASWRSRFEIFIASARGFEVGRRACRVGCVGPTFEVGSTAVAGTPACPPTDWPLFDLLNNNLTTTPSVIDCHDMHGGWRRLKLEWARFSGLHHPNPTNLALCLLHPGEMTPDGSKGRIDGITGHFYF